jgi:hypothetical protein
MTAVNHQLTKDILTTKILEQRSRNQPRAAEPQPTQQALPHSKDARVRRGFVQDDFLIQSQWVRCPAACSELNAKR